MKNKSRKDKKEKWFVSLGYSTFIGRRKIGETQQITEG